MTQNPALSLPAGTTVFERGWLSANNILLVGSDATALVDSGYWTHADQTVRLVQQALAGRSLDVLLSTHLHSDHCGGNAALQSAYPQMHTRIPPGQAAAVADWDPEALTYAPTGQHCPPFGFNDVLAVGSELDLGGIQWAVHAAPGHDPHSVILFEPRTRTLISADALWENGFGVVFPELEGVDAFSAVAATLDLIESLQPAVIIPGHGRVFNSVDESLATARRRLDSFERDPQKHALHAGKVLLKFKLLEWQRVSRKDLERWAFSTRYLALLHYRFFEASDFGEWLEQLIDGLVRAQAAQRQADLIVNL